MKIKQEISKMITQALADCESMNTDRQWAKLRINKDSILLDYGTIHSNGFHERAIGTRGYFIDSDGNVKFLSQAHT